jgi:hypothetical protein
MGDDVSLASAFAALMDSLGSAVSEVGEAVESYCEETEELFFSDDPNSERSMILEEIMNSEDAWDLAINLVTRDQLLDKQITPWGSPMPEYKPRTIRYKVQRGFPPEWRVRYTEYDKGVFYNHGVNLVTDRSRMVYWFEIPDFAIQEYPYFAYIPEEYIDLTEENREYFEWQVGEWLNARLVQEYLNREV